jgi:tripartite-type tricarboxylate transporter receptor subunit TctC
MKQFRTALMVSVATAALLTAPAAHAADKAADFYKGVGEIKMVIGAGPAGSYDTYARLLGRHIGNHIPGNPTVTPLNMPGASGIKAANWVANQGPQDGSVISNIRYNFAMYQALGNLPQVKTDVRAFHWIGSLNATNHLLVTYKTAPAKTLEEAKEHEVLIGQASPRSFGTMMCHIYNAMLGTKLKVITGYGEINKVKLAMQRGEVQGVGDDGWTDLQADFAEMLHEHRLNILLQVGLKKEPELPDVPLLLDLAKTPDEKAAFDFITKSDASMGKPFATSPGVPGDRVKVLRKAFDDTMKDPALLKDAKKLQIAIEPISGDDIQQMVADIMGTPKPIRDHLKTVLGIKAGKAIQ